MASRQQRSQFHFRAAAADVRKFLHFREKSLRSDYQLALKFINFCFIDITQNSVVYRGMIYGRNESGGAEASALPLILLVDDEPEILPEYQEFLELKGYDAAISSDPEEAYRIVMAQPQIELVVTDLKMAGLDGVGLIRKLRANLPPERHLEFIILTGDATSQISDDIAGIPLFIKPADTNGFLAAVKVALAKSQ